MPHFAASYAPPQWAVVRWLTDAGRDVPTDIRARLIAGFFTSTAPLLLGATANIVVNLVACILYPVTTFIGLLALDAALLLLRVVLLAKSHRAAGQGRPTPTDVFLLSSLAWAALVGVGTALCLSSGDPVLEFLAPTTMMGIVSGMATRNNGAPRLAVIQVMLCDIPLQFAIPFLGHPWMLISIFQCPLFVLGMIATIHRLNRGYMAVVIAERESERRATHDALTSVLNRAGLMDALNLALKEAVWQRSGFALLYLDLDGFKGVNDTFGHAAGDELLRQVTKRMTETVPETCLKGRMGGDEFVILVPGRDAAEVKVIGEALVEAICTTYDIVPGATVSVGVSIGIACVGSETTVDSLLAEADAALYEAKTTGKGRCVLSGDRTSRRLLSALIAA